MVPSNDPLKTGAKRSPSPLREIARECWVLACWLTLRRTWAQWEKDRAGDATKQRPQSALPADVEAFFGRYAHAAYCKWIPVVAKETVTRKERERKEREDAKAEADQFNRLLNEESPEDEPLLESASLQKGEELFGALAQEHEWDVESPPPEQGSDILELRRGGSQEVKMAFHALNLEVPARPVDGNDRTPWVAWLETQAVLWEPRKRSRRVLMNELFKQPAGKPTASATDMLRCLTGYLKSIIREAVRAAAREAIRTRDGSDESFSSLDAPVSRSDPSESYTGMDVIAGGEDTRGTVSRDECLRRAQILAEEEFSHEKMTDGVRLAYFMETLRGENGAKGLVIALNHPAILSHLKMGGATLYEHVQKSRCRIANQVHDDWDKFPYTVRMFILASAIVALRQMATDWFWSEKVEESLFLTVMDIIHTEKDKGFACPRAKAREIRPTLTNECQCWDCTRKL